MKVLDIMIPAKDNENIVAHTDLDSGQDVLALSDISTLPPIIGVRNQQGQIVGSVERETLLFLKKKL